MAKPLTAITVTKARARTTRRESPDGGCRGLYLVVQPSRHKSLGRTLSVPRETGQVRPWSGPDRGA